jgi:hypothetical protein
LPVVKTFTLIGLGEKTRFFFGLFDRPYQWRVISLETEKKNTLLLGCNREPLLRAKMPKKRNFCGFGFGRF